MARKPALSAETLAALGAEKLAALVLDETQSNPGFKRRVNAALAGQSGPDAIAKLIDRRLAGLERARSFVDLDKERAFRDDLQGLCDSIAKELLPAGPALAAVRLLRFIATHEQVFQRIDDSSGRIQDVYWQAIEAMAPAAEGMPTGVREALPEAIMAVLGETDHGYLKPVAERVILHMPSEALLTWDADLAARITERDAVEAGQRASGRWFPSMTGEWREIRQVIAAATDDLDQVIALEREKPEQSQDSLTIAAKLLEAGRAEEALIWVRRAAPTTRRAHDDFDVEDEGAEAEHDPAILQASLEARILAALGRKPEASQLLWARFTETLSPRLLREHLKTLPDFEDIEAEERAMALTMHHPEPMGALHFFLAWPRRDLAARLIVTRHEAWDGRDWYTLPDIADQLQHEHPLAATILYRALLDDILARARSKAYPHGAKHLERLALLARDADADPARPAVFPLHEEYRETLRATHGRKSGFWTLTGDKPAAKPPEPFRAGRHPIWVVEK
ncbi:DUF6880 family protein [Paracoccus sp. IB05]|uniref:DUF6880 family protein n=1 Tax=Paracoccus sp. IB05 TaxID=2779367 RepID=UPI0018E8F2F0|nr:DUF6880 family protein [Paracoccus sp. IB05]MBJ2152682.1 hypothetical protein [Paracoccus sp. IB05]